MTIKRKWGEESVFIIINEDDVAKVRGTEEGATGKIEALLDEGVTEDDILVYEARQLSFSVETKVSLKEDC